jgi:uncharacterized protein YndB with AHSA1/START domain
MIDPLQISVVVQCDLMHAFAVFTEKASMWWPPTHSVSREPGLAVIFEPKVGGRIFERTPARTEFDWGQILVWDPPNRLGYLWHIRTDRAQATEVQIRFVPLPDGTTRVDIEHTGWGRLGEAGQSRRDANGKGWGGMLPHFVAACSPGRKAIPEPVRGA